MKRYDAEIAAQWASVAESPAHQFFWASAIWRRVLDDDIRDFVRRSRCEIDAIHELRQKGATDDLARPDRLG